MLSASQSLGGYLLTVASDTMDWEPTPHAAAPEHTGQRTGNGGRCLNCINEMKPAAEAQLKSKLCRINDKRVYVNLLLDSVLPITTPVDTGVCHAVRFDGSN